MSVSFGPSPTAIEFGPRNTGQQLTTIKWSVKLANDYWLYFGAPVCELSAENSRAALLSLDNTGKTVIEEIKAKALVLTTTVKPESVKVFYAYSKTSLGDLEPGPRFPDVVGSDGKERPPNDAEKEFTLYCADLLPSYDVTLRRTERKDKSIKFLGSSFFEDAKPFDSTRPAIPSPAGVAAEPFTAWRAKATPVPKAGNTYTLPEFFSEVGMKKYTSGAFRKSTGKLTISDSKNKCTIEFANMELITLQADFGKREIFTHKLYFKPKVGRPIAVVTLRRSAGHNPIVELRDIGTFLDGKLRRAAMRTISDPFVISINFDSETQISPASVGTQVPVGSDGGGGFIAGLALFGVYVGLWVACWPVALGLTFFSMVGASASAK
jgi:hypothetical protein